MALSGGQTRATAGHGVLLSYAATLLITGAAFLFWRLGIHRVGMSPYFLYLAAVTMTSWLYGLGPALLCTGLSILLANFAYSFQEVVGLRYPRGVLQTVLFLLVALSITAINSQRRSLLQSERLIRQRFERLAAEQGAILGQMTEAVIVADTAGRVRYLNDAARTILGIDAGVGEPLSDVLVRVGTSTSTGRAVPIEDTALIRAARGEQVVNVERRLQRPDGTGLDVVTNARQVRNADGNVLGVVATVRDVTVERELEREREAIRAAVVHDLKNPLTTIKGMTTLLERRLKLLELPARSQETLMGQLDVIDARSEQMLRLITEFMEASLSDEPAALELTSIDLIALVRRLVEAHAAGTETHGIRLEAAVPELVGEWDAAQLERAVDNLVANAVKYSPGGGEIVVEVRPERENGDQYAVLAVSDQGIGIPEHDRMRVFERAYRARNAGEIGGTGVGLATVKKIVDRHGGRISLSSREGRRTTVEIRLPASRLTIAREPGVLHSGSAEEP